MLDSNLEPNDGWLQRVVDFRRYLHARPCLSGYEADTVAMIRQFLGAAPPHQEVTLAGGTGIAFVYKGNRPGKRLLLRADTDALPIQEINTFHYRSKVERVSHTCGHDGHTAMLAGIAPQLVSGNFSGEVVLLFQPAEEIGKGAAAIIRDPAFDMISPDFVAGLHNLPGYPLGSVCLREGAFAAASEGITIRLTGKTAHAAYPDHGLSPAMAVAQLLTGLEGIKNPVSDPDEFHLVTVVYAQLGSLAFGTAPGEAEIAATLRTFSNQGIDSLKSRLSVLAHEVAARHDLGSSVAFSESFRATFSDASMVKAASLAAEAAGRQVIWLPDPFRWSEDFGQFSERWPGVFAGMGSGLNQSPLHQADYDFPDDLIPFGIAYWEQLVRQILT